MFFGRPLPPKNTKTRHLPAANALAGHTAPRACRLPHLEWAKKGLAYASVYQIDIAAARNMGSLIQQILVYLFLSYRIS